MAAPRTGGKLENVTKERLDQIEETYSSALKLNGGEREAFLNDKCGNDKDLRREVESLLAFGASETKFLDQSTDAVAASVFAEQDKTARQSGKMFAHYRIVTLLGVGGMGEVYLAEDTKLDRKVALKMLPEAFVGDSDRMGRFVREAKSASALNHPNIITIYEIGESEGTHFIATEFIDGTTVGEYARTRALNVAEILEIGIQIAAALDEAHKAGIVHRDIKPDNIMVRKDGIVKILDFGLAKPSAMGSDASGDETDVSFQTQPGLIVGTPNYMSPEQARGQNIDHRTDIFSFGIVLYQMLSGDSPFAGDTVSDIIAAVLMKEPAKLRDLPPELEGIIFKALQKDTRDRYQTASELVHDLKSARHDAGIQTRLGQISPQVTTDVSPEAQTVVIDQTPTVIQERPNNLSGQLTPMIGRTDELSKIVELIKRHETRLLTVTGVGGTGKTTLAKAIARKSLENFADGVFFVELAAIADHELIHQVIAQTVGVKETSDRSIKESLKEFLSQRNILLVLDNFEQIINASSAIGELLTDSANLKIVVTSRVRLNLRFESEFTLQPLEIPAGNDLSPDDLSQYAAIALFVDRARSARANFTLTAENAEDVAAICRRLDGLPLAIELAAVQVKMLAPKAIRTRLEKNLQILSSRAGDMPERQRTMHAAIAWSYDLLGDDEKKLFDRVSVFRGGFIFESAEAAANAEGSIDVFGSVISLVDKSLLVSREQSDGEPRLKMLQVVREFARENLRESNEENAIRHLHAEFFTELAERAEIGFRGEESSNWLETIELENDNYRAALEWTLLYEPETALRIVAALPEFWFRRGHLVEGNKWARQALDANGDSADQRLLARALIATGSLMWRQGDLSESEKFYSDAVKLSREIPDNVLIATSLSGLGTVKMLRGDNAEALPRLEESFAISNEANDKYLASRVANVLGEIFRSNEDHETAKSYYEKALTIARQESFKHVIQIACVNLSAVACSMEDYYASREYAMESLKLAEAAGDAVGMGFAMERFMALAVIEGKHEKAARIYGSLEKTYESAGFIVEAVDQAFLDSYLDQAKAAIGDEHFRQAILDGRSMNVKDLIAETS